MNTEIHFKKDSKDLAFQKELYRRINSYFSNNNLSKVANAKAIAKAIILGLLYLALTVSLFFATTIGNYYLINILLGMLTIFVALNIAHDAAHNIFSSNQKVNNLLLYTFDILGASGYMWRLKHVHSHHPHVNIPNMDGDIKQTNLVRIFPNSPFLRLHKYQYLYMPVLYLFYTLMWLLIRDFKDYFHTDISGKPDVKHPPVEYVKLMIGKSFFFGRMLILPMLILPFTGWQVLLGFLLFHFSASLTVAMALISAHIGEDSVYPAPDEDGQMENSWIRHQIITTCDFGTQSKVLTHLFGGFNHHIIHHLCPNICHIHYPHLTEVLKSTCQEYGMPYNSNPTLCHAMLSHLRFLKIRSKQGVRVEYIEI